MDRLDRRTYDILRLIETHGPVGSIRLGDLLERYGYSINDRTIRLTLSELDDEGLTTKIPGKGRRLTEDGRTELRRGDISGRLDEVRAQIAQLTGRVTYDPDSDTGELVTAAAFVDEADVDEALSVLEPVADSPLAPLLVALDEPYPTHEGTVALCFPSSITLDGVLLEQGVDGTLQTAGLVQYQTDPDPDVPHEGELSSDHGGAVLRYTDALSGEDSTVDVATLFIEAGRVEARRALESDEPARILVDNRTVPMTRYEKASSLAVTTRDRLGGVVDVRRPREQGPFPVRRPSWNFASITYGGIGEFALALLSDAGLTDDWETLYGLESRAAFAPVERGVGATDLPN